ncbi:SAM-dependent methyltransferase [Micractinium conductrix]|uniref:SAM-dependent methyltransferase n=1 Tax=Micractinium conductrix TaxID=554055 RepID=A0A2P6V4K1_9CHLO|nr:SAM-dependent methyltransferase [Micractinium conductrix]|eukprot:PSC69007.1 SAM-dependent methyltransferase [Micractinium conductrix]
MPPPWDDEDGLLSDDLLEEQEEWVEVGEEGVHGFRAALFSSQAAHYARFRPSYPEHIFNHIYDFAKAALGNEPGLGSRELALDVGCGHGVVALELAKKYSKVVGVDASVHQLQHAHQGPTISYLHAPCEALSQHLPAQSVDLIAMAETLHWVDQQAFYEQCRRILKPTGVLAIWCYDLNEFAPIGPHQTQATVDQANGLMQAHTYGTLGPYWDDRRQYIDRRYRGLEPQTSVFRHCKHIDNLSMEHIMSMDHFMGYLASWSPYAAYRATHPDRPDPLVELRAQLKELLAVTDDAAPSLRLLWPVFFLLCKDPVQ